MADDYAKRLDAAQRKRYQDVRRAASAEIRKIRARRKQLADELRKARRTRQQIKAHVREICRQRQRRTTTAGRTLREHYRRLANRQIRKWREQSRRTCDRDLAKARKKYGRTVEALIAQLEAERRELERQVELRRRHQAPARRKATAQQKREARQLAGQRAAERRAESDDEVRANIDPELLPVWEKVKRKIKATPRMTRTEAFEQWVHDHSADVQEILFAAHEAAAEQLWRERERLERDAQRIRDASRKPLAKMTAEDRHYLEQLPAAPF